MKAKFLIAVSMLFFASLCAFAQSGTGHFPPPIIKKNVYVKRPNVQPTVIYNATTTMLTVKMPAITSGKVEIYRNGVKVVDATATAGSNLSFVLRNYGNGNYAIIVRQENTVVYSSSVEVKKNNQLEFSSLRINGVEPL